MRLKQDTLALAALLLLPFTCTLAALYPDIRADTNRDGRVDITGDTDVHNKGTWSSTRGAIFLPNIGDSSGRCAKTDLNGGQLSNAELAYCSDAAGDELLAPEYAAPLRTISMPDLSSEAFAYVYATPDAAYERVRLFLGETVDDDEKTVWTLLDRRYRLNATQLQSGLVLALDSRELVRDKSIWDGQVLIQLDVYDGEDSGSDSVVLKLAPVLTHHHLQEVETLVSVAADSDAQRRFLCGLNESRQEAGIQEPLLLLNQTDDIWAQDFFEPGYSSMPGPDGPIAIRIMLRSAQSTRTAGRQVFDTLRGNGIGGFQPAPGFGHEEINSFGNLETIPPYTSKSGVAYKSGRIITGKHFGQLPAESMLNFLNSQEVQAPLILETGWLLIGHVDEFVQFLPFDNELGWTIAIADTNVALDLLSHASEAGHGNVHAISFNRTSGSGDYGSADPKDLALTIDDILGNQTLREVNNYAQRHIDANLESLLSEIDLPREQVIRVPTLFRTPIWDMNDLTNRGGLPPHSTPLMPGEYQLMAFWPATINGVVLGKNYAAPRPWGPVIDDEDIVAKASQRVYARANMTVSFVDDYLSHHVGGGEVHCGSNTLRQIDFQWWN